ncbi:D-xylose-proton symporter [Synechococcus sp. MIT S9509]|nr:D-xylose-proton symporter [Synechococcus sp. MIT S9504]KZR92716.1 D-xylose-proton symporter [Synechococcus sp. MIT S9509]
MLLVDRLGRKQLLLIGSAGMTLSLLALSIGLRGLVMPQGPDSLSGSSTVVVMIAVNLFVFSFGCSWGPVLWILLGELFSNRIREKALGVSVTAKWLATILISLSFPLWLKHA